MFETRILELTSQTKTLRIHRPARKRVKPMKTLQKIMPSDLIVMDEFVADGALRIELAYAQEDNLLFDERIYRKDARLWLHTALADIVVQAARLVKKQGFRLVLYDGLRTTDAQSRMLDTQAVKNNPHWLEEPRLLSPPGAGAHPRGMAIDCSLETLDGELLDMGTAFDFLSNDPSPEANPAHREHPHHAQDVMNNRGILDEAMIEAASLCDCELLLLAQEWWDFRLPPSIYEAYEPLSDGDLPPDIRMMR